MQPVDNTTAFLIQWFFWSVMYDSSFFYVQCYENIFNKCFISFFFQILFIKVFQFTIQKNYSFKVCEDFHQQFFKSTIGTVIIGNNSSNCFILQSDVQGTKIVSSYFYCFPKVSNTIVEGFCQSIPIRFLLREDYYTSILHGGWEHGWFKCLIEDYQ